MRRLIGHFSLSASILILSACGPIRDMQTLVDTTKEMKEQTTKLNKGMDKTNDAVHRQVLVISLQQLTAPENTESLHTPARMLPFANTFAEEATTEELIKEFHTLWTDVQFGGETTNVPATPEDVRLKSRNVAYRAASAIAAMTTDEKFAEIVRTNIVMQSRFEETAYAFALCRYEFTSEYLFKPVVEKTKKLNLDALRKAVGYYRSMKTVAQSPYTAQMSFDIASFKEEVQDGKKVVVDAKIEFNDGERSAKAKSAARRFKRELSKSTLALPETQSLLNELQ